MNARLLWNDRFGHPIDLVQVERYAGCIKGYRNGVVLSRPLADVALLSLDGSTWEPVSVLLKHVPWGEQNV